MLNLTVMGYGVVVVVFSDYHLFQIFLIMWDFGRVYVVYRLPGPWCNNMG